MEWTCFQFQLEYDSMYSYKLYSLYFELGNLRMWKQAENMFYHKMHEMEGVTIFCNNCPSLHFFYVYFIFVRRMCKIIIALCWWHYQPANIYYCRMRFNILGPGVEPFYSWLGCKNIFDHCIFFIWAGSKFLGVQNCFLHEVTLLYCVFIFVHSHYRFIQMMLLGSRWFVIWRYYVLLFSDCSDNYGCLLLAFQLASKSRVLIQSKYCWR